MIAKAYPDDEELALMAKRQREEEREEEFAKGMQEHQKQFFSAVSDSKPYVDYFGLLLANAIMAALFFGSIVALTEGGRPYFERSLVVMLISGFMWWKLNRYLIAATSSLADIGLISFAKLVRMPYPYGSSLRSATLRWLVGCYTVLAMCVVIMGSGWVGYEIAQRTGAILDIRSDAKAPDAKKADDAKPADNAPDPSKKAADPKMTNTAKKAEPAAKDGAQSKTK